MPPQPTPTLSDDILEEIFLRLPSDEPAWLVRASLASKLWLGLLSGPRFRGRYRDFHGAPPMLGFVCRFTYDKDPVSCFVSNAKFIPRFSQEKDRGCHGYDVLDCRHGRVLLGHMRRGKILELVVWDPMTGRRRELDVPEEYVSHGAAVLCAVTRCDHSACHNGPFRVVFVGVDRSDVGCFASAHVSFSQIGEWNKPRSHLHLAENAFIDSMCPVLIEDALYFILVDADDVDDNEDDYYDDDDLSILKYDLDTKSLSRIDAPFSMIVSYGDVLLMAMEDGSLGFARVSKLSLYLWSMQMESNGVASWNACRVIHLGEFIPIQNPKNELKLIGSVERTNIVYVYVITDLGIYEISLKSLEWKKILKRENLCALLPYMSFYDPLERVNTFDVAH